MLRLILIYFLTLHILYIFIGLRIEKVVFVCGKLYYDLVKERQNKKLEDKVAIIRIEVM